MQTHGHADNPYMRPGQNWRCGRDIPCKVGPDNQGRCNLGDNPCNPVRSVGAKKRRITFWIFGLVVGVFSIVLTLQTLVTSLSPGPLSINHGEVASCQDCHTAASEPMSNWLHKAIALNTNNDDQKCINCHELGSAAFMPHSTSNANFTNQGESLRESEVIPSTERINWKLKFASSLHDYQNNSSQNDVPEEVSCSVCHREHQGEFAPIDAFDAQQCHTCHEVKFSELDTDHPQYSDYPHTRPTRIHFDHAAHLDDYFYQADYLETAPDGCKTCHNTDQTGEWMLLSSFETACSSCHLEEILGINRASAKGLTVFSIPELDKKSLVQAGFNVGEWPSSADGELLPIMKLLLPQALQNSVGLGKNGLKLYDLSDANQAELEAIAELAWEIKQWFYDIQMGGTKILNDQISNVFNNALDQSTLNRLVASLPKDTLINNQLEWFPNLFEEVQQYRSGAIKIFSESASETEKPLGSQANAEDTAEPQQTDILASQDDILLDGEMEPSDDEISLDDDILGSIDDGSFDLQEIDDDANSEGDIQVQAEIIRTNEEWADSGGWYRDGSSIRYRPTDHADPFFKTWLEVSSVEYNQIGAELFESLSDPKSVGKCIECHSVELISDTQDQAGMHFQVNWQSFKPNDVAVDFNRFSHVAHFSLMNDGGCSSCHLLDQNESEPISTDTQTIVSSFLDIDRDTCTQCHQQGRAPDNCLTCHNYHAEGHTESINQISDSLSGGVDD